MAQLAVAVKQEQKHTGQKVSLEEKKELIEALENKNGFETEKLLSQEFDFTPTPKEKILPRKDEVYLTLKLSKDQLRGPVRAKESISPKPFGFRFIKKRIIAVSMFVRPRESAVHRNTRVK